MTAGGVPRRAGPAARRFPLIEELPPGIEAWDAFRSVSRLPGAVFFDSALRDPLLGRHSFVAADPFRILRWRSGEPGDPFSLLAAGISEFTSIAGAGTEAEETPGLPPFRGGAAGLLGYGLGRSLEDIPPFRFDEFQAPDLAMGLYDRVLAFDHLTGKAWAISQGFPESEPARRASRARRRIDEVLGLLSRPAPSPVEADAAREGKGGGAPAIPRAALLAPAREVGGVTGVLSDFSREEYVRAVKRAIEYVRAGDVFQVNLAQRLLAPRRTGPVEFYGRLRERNPAPFAAFLSLGDVCLASASPERFLRVAGDIVETRPIKGTRRRGATEAEDRAIREELERCPKDRAENVMIVDLLRNDLSRVSRPFTVEVPSLFRVESYSTVHHLVSEVRGRLREGRGAIDLLRAAFPGGSVTGAPKIRAMEIIAEMEPAARGAYCGSLAWIGFDGAMDSSVLIRTVTHGRGWLQFPVGGGIVALSDPDEEYAETLAKAEGILRALG